MFCANFFFKLAEWFGRRRQKCEKFTTMITTTTWRRWWCTTDKLLTCSFCSGELKTNFMLMTVRWVDKNLLPTAVDHEVGEVDRGTAPHRVSVDRCRGTELHMLYVVVFQAKVRRTAHKSCLYKIIIKIRKWRHYGSTICTYRSLPHPFPKQLAVNVMLVVGEAQIGHWQMENFAIRINLYFDLFSFTWISLNFTET